MIIQESKLIEEEYVDGYYLTMNDLRKLLSDFEEITNKRAYIEEWLRNHTRIVKKD